MKVFTGKWRISKMELWAQDYVELETPGYIRIKADGTGMFQFGLVSGEIDGRVELCDDQPRFEFSWDGQDESIPTNGRGWAVIENGKMSGRIFIHRGDNSSFLAIKPKPSKAPL